MGMKVLEILAICLALNCSSVLSQVFAGPTNTLSSSTSQDGVQVDVHVAVNGDEGNNVAAGPGGGGDAIPSEFGGPLPVPAALTQAPPPSTAVITLYWRQDFSGTSRQVTLNRGDCFNVGSHWNDQTSSIDTPVCTQGKVLIDDFQILEWMMILHQLNFAKYSCTIILS